ncbi:MAG: pyridoxamine 5'-phosphate oxidase family protein [Candidatus Micrarchaeaceae archaeon]
MGEHYNAYEEKAKKIIVNSTYMVVGTSTKDGIPWVAPVLFVHDKDYNIYFLSAVDARHSKNLAENPNVSISIFDSNQKIGSFDGIQAEGEASLVEKGEIKKAITLYCKKVFPNSDMEPTKRYVPEDYLGASEFRFFKIKLTEIYLAGSEDRRVKVELSGV